MLPDDDPPHPRPKRRGDVAAGRPEDAQPARGPGARRRRPGARPGGRSRRRRRPRGGRREPSRRRSSEVSGARSSTGGVRGPRPGDPSPPATGRPRARGPARNCGPRAARPPRSGAASRAGARRGGGSPHPGRAAGGTLRERARLGRPMRSRSRSAEMAVVRLPRPVTRSASMAAAWSTFSARARPGRPAARRPGAPPRDARRSSRSAERAGSHAVSFQGCDRRSCDRRSRGSAPSPDRRPPPGPALGRRLAPPRRRR